MIEIAGPVEARGDENLARPAQVLEGLGAPPSFAAHVRSLGEDEIVYFGRPPARVGPLRTLEVCRPSASSAAPSTERSAAFR
jgi:hypothetical protein